jgi:hypothetical protein
LFYDLNFENKWLEEETPNIYEFMKLGF